MIKKVILTGFVMLGVMAAGVNIQVLGAKIDAGAGILAIKDTYTKKTFVLEVIPESSADVSGVPLGAEILKINDKRIRWLSVDEINALLNSNNGSEITLKIKNGKEKAEYTLKSENYKIQGNEDNKFNLYWEQIAPEGIYLKKIPEVVLAKLSTDYQDDVLSRQIFWLKQKKAFKDGYNTCKTYPEEEQNTCLLNLVNTINNNISRNRQLDIHSDGVARQQDGIPIYNVNQIMLQNAFQNFGDRY